MDGDGRGTKHLKAALDRIKEVWPYLYPRREAGQGTKRGYDTKPQEPELLGAPMWLCRTEVREALTRILSDPTKTGMLRRYLGVECIRCYGQIKPEMIGKTDICGTCADDLRDQEGK